MALILSAIEKIILTRPFLIASTIVLAYFVAITDHDFFNVSQLVGIHHEPVFLGLIFLLGAEVFVPNRFLVGLLFFIGLVASLAVIVWVNPVA